MIILKEAINTHTEILGMGAVFAYHRQLNALGCVGRGRGEGRAGQVAVKRPKLGLGGVFAPLTSHLKCGWIMLISESASEIIDQLCSNYS